MNICDLVRVMDELFGENLIFCGGRTLGRTEAKGLMQVVSRGKHRLISVTRRSVGVQDHSDAHRKDARFYFVKAFSNTKSLSLEN